MLFCSLKQPDTYIQLLYKHTNVMTQRSPRLIGGILVVALLAVTAGCAAAIGGDPDPEMIADELNDRHDNIDDVQGTQVVTIDREDSTERTVTKVVERPPTESRQEVIESDSEWQSEGDVIVQTDNEMISYDADENTVTEFEFDHDPEQTPFATEEMISDALNDSEISYEGTETVADRAVHVIALTDEDHGTTTVWADQEFWYPLKTETAFEQGDDEWTMTMSYEEVTFNEGVDDAAFTFDPPEDATVEEFESPETQTVDSPDAVDAAVPFEFAEPDLPEKFTFEQATVSERDDSVTAFVSYEADDETVSYSLTDDTTHDPSGESVEIGNTEGTISEFGDQTSVVWDCDGVRHSLSGELDRETLIDSAASADC